MIPSTFFSIFLICLTLPHCGFSEYLEELEKLTPSQRKTLEEFRSQVADTLPHPYMKEDLYLSRFLRTKDYRLRDSVKAIKEAMEWRQLNGLDRVDSEDFSDLEEDFPVFHDGVDKQGRVIMEANFGQWPMRTAVVAGKLPRLKRYGVKAIEDSTTMVRRLREANGGNVTQWVMLLNMEGFSVIEQACPSCLPYYLNFVTSYEKYYPFTVAQAIFVNTPESFEIVLSLLRPLMNIQTRKAMKIFGSDQSKWRPYLEEHFDYEQIGNSLGGHKKRRTRH